jgi:hemoglobin-like flavoprotein
MNALTNELVRASWSQVEPIAPAAAALFYRHLFADAPELRALFRGDLQQQGDKLMRMLGWLVAHLDDMPALLPALADLGRRHAGYGVQASHYDRVGAHARRGLKPAVHAGHRTRLDRHVSGGDGHHDRGRFRSRLARADRLRQVSRGRRCGMAGSAVPPRLDPAWHSQRITTRDAALTAPHAATRSDSRRASAACSNCCSRG